MTERPSLDLQIHGKGLLLSGTFTGWQSQLILGPDLDDVGVCLFVDATSVGPSNDVGENLFSFRSRSVEPAGKGKYRVLGDFTCADATRELAIDVETPLGHTPLIAVSFAAARKDFAAAAWASLVENATILDGPADDAGPQPEAAAWLTPPHLAAA
jgi:hypothetical protein